MQESGEMYIETIHILSQKSDSVRSIDVAKFRGFSKASVSRAMSVLKSEGYISIDSKGNITLEPPGLKIATSMYERHNVLAQMLMRLGVNEETATSDACKMEHVISEESFEAIKCHMNKSM